MNAIVTGAGTGMGEAIARSLVEAGARVAFVGRTRKTLEAAAADLDSEQAFLEVCDVGDRAATNEMVARVTAQLGPVELLICSAGINSRPRGLGDIDPEAFDRVVNINLTGVFNAMRAVLPGMRQLQRGTIVNISSIAGRRPTQVGGVAYSASKFGVVSLSYTVNQEERQNNIRSCVICPGETSTPILDQRAEPPTAEQRALMLQPQDVADAVMFVVRLPQHANVPEIIIHPTKDSFL
jgi:NADP-dependent 3-hydroxy acid dehydrogenase YdfG